MTHGEIVNLFPVEVKVSYWDLIFANRMSNHSCYGARTLKRFLKSKNVAVKDLSWGSNSGAFVIGNTRYYITNSSGQNVMYSTFKDRRYTFKCECSYLA